MTHARLLAPLSLLFFLVACAGDKTSAGDSAADSGAVVVDGDGDGISAEEDCDDNNPDVFPGAEEICDALDNNCDGSVDEGALLTFYSDGDGDGYGVTESQACEAPSGAATLGGDCDDADPTLTPEDYDADGLSSCDGDCDDTNDNLIDRCTYSAMEGVLEAPAGPCSYEMTGGAVDGSSQCPACDFSFDSLGVQVGGGVECLPDFGAVLGYDRAIGALHFQIRTGPDVFERVGKFPASVTYGTEYDVLTFSGYGSTGNTYYGHLDLWP